MTFRLRIVPEGAGESSYREAAASMRLVSFGTERAVVGSGAAADVRVGAVDEGVADQHLVLERSPTGLLVRDLGAAVDGVRFRGDVLRGEAARRPLTSGDAFHFGSYRVDIEDTAVGDAAQRRLDAWLDERGIGSAPLPTPLRAQLRIERYLVATTRAPPVPNPYDHWALIDELDAAAAAGDYALCGYGGHGVNSWAWGYYVAFGPLTLLVKLGFGGLYEGDRAASGDRVSRCFAAAGELLEIIAPVASHPVRERLAIFASDLYPCWVAQPGRRPSESARAAQERFAAGEPGLRSGPLELLRESRPLVERLRASVEHGRWPTV